MKKSSKVVFALTGLAVFCVCAAMAAPMGAGDGTGHRGMMKGGDGAPAMNEECMQEKILWFQETGIDTTDLETALENGDRDAVHAFMQENRPADAPEMKEERMQQMIQRMQANGIDTSALETALESGDRDAVHAFMKANHPTDAPAMNQERMQQMIQKMQADGVDTSALETALENGDMNAIRTFLQENRPADAGTGFRQGVSSTE